MKCGVYTYRSVQGRKIHLALTEEFAKSSPWYSFEREIPCGSRVRHADGEVISLPQAAPRGRASTYLFTEASLLRLGPVSDADYDLRQGHCRRCEFLVPSPDDPLGYCGRCGCDHNERARLTVKLRMPDAKCPLGRFGSAPGTGRANLRKMGGFRRQLAGVMRNAMRQMRGRK